MSAPQPALSPEFAVGMRDSLLQGLGRELEITKKVIAAIPEDKRDYRPDPKARTAWELAWHLASCDVQMRDEVADHKFEMEPRFKEEPKKRGGTCRLVRQELHTRNRACTGHDSGTALHAGGFYLIFPKCRPSMEGAPTSPGKASR
jgi:hypothetical protein